MCVGVGGRHSDTWPAQSSPGIWKWLKVSFGCHSGRMQGTTVFRRQGPGTLNVLGV